MTRVRGGQVRFLLLFLCAVLPACMTPGAVGSNPAQEEITRKQERLAALREDLTTGRLREGAPEALARERYGDPDDVFSSGSTASHFAIWQYEPVLTGKETDDKAMPVKLYFDTGRLVSWRY